MEKLDFSGSHIIIIMDARYMTTHTDLPVGNLNSFLKKIAIPNCSDNCGDFYNNTIIMYSERVVWLIVEIPPKASP